MIDPSKYFSEYFSDISESLRSVDSNLLASAANMIWDASKLGKKTIVVGNGGSAAMASHVAVDFTKAAGVRAITFNEADLITCFANDYGYEQWVVEALKAYADKGDVAILISSSGTSKNIVNGTLKAKELGLKTITLSGFSKDNDLNNKGDINFWIGSSSYNYVEMTHHVWLVAMVDYLIQIHSNSLNEE
jgi:D-sedoheptulose 7-phosphate isomerase